MLVMFLVSFFFFFKQKTSYEMRISDWSSDVCSSDLYGRVLVERVEGFATEAEWRKGYDEINEFEAQLTGSRTNLVKLFIHVTPAEQDKRDRKSVVKGKSVSVRVDLGGRRLIKTKRIKQGDIMRKKER